MSGHLKSLGEFLDEPVDVPEMVLEIIGTLRFLCNLKVFCVSSCIVFRVGFLDAFPMFVTT